MAAMSSSRRASGSDEAMRISEGRTRTVAPHAKMLRLRVRLFTPIIRVRGHRHARLHHQAADILLLYAVVEASDGYRVLFALAELDPAFSDKRVYLVIKRDGKPLSEKEGLFRIVVPRPVLCCGANNTSNLVESALSCPSAFDYVGSLSAGIPVNSPAPGAIAWISGKPRSGCTASRDCSLKRRSLFRTTYRKPAQSGTHFFQVPSANLWFASRLQGILSQDK
jgi:hypothetical protein